MINKTNVCRLHGWRTKITFRSHYGNEYITKDIEVLCSDYHDLLKYNELIKYSHNNMWRGIIEFNTKDF